MSGDEEVEIHGIADRFGFEGREAGVGIRELTGKHGISGASDFNWRWKHSGVTVSELKRMTDLEAENTKLKRLYADLGLENAALKDVIS